MRVLFLDFDGVLHSTNGRGESMREYIWLPIVKKMISGHNDLRIVVHASARIQSDPVFLGARLGLRETVFLGVTSPRLDRWPSIQKWLAERDDVTSFRILDDQVLEFPDPPPQELILCTSHQGVSEKRVQNELRTWLLSGPMRERRDPFD